MCAWEKLRFVVCKCVYECQCVVVVVWGGDGCRVCVAIWSVCE